MSLRIVCYATNSSFALCTWRDLNPLLKCLLNQECAEKPHVKKNPPFNALNAHNAPMTININYKDIHACIDKRGTVP